MLETEREQWHAADGHAFRLAHGAEGVTTVETKLSFADWVLVVTSEGCCKMMTRVDKGKGPP